MPRADRERERSFIAEARQANSLTGAILGGFSSFKLFAQLFS